MSGWTSPLVFEFPCKLDVVLEIGSVPKAAQLNDSNVGTDPRLDRRAFQPLISYADSNQRNAGCRQTRQLKLV